MNTYILLSGSYQETLSSILYSYYFNTVCDFNYLYSSLDGNSEKLSENRNIFFPTIVSLMWLRVKGTLYNCFTSKYRNFENKFKPLSIDFTIVFGVKNCTHVKF